MYLRCTSLFRSYFLVTLLSCGTSKYLLDKHQPAPLKSHIASPRGIPDNNLQLENPECGVRFGDALLGRGHGRDLDSNTEYGEYPWHVAILVTINHVTEYTCGGALIDARHVLTAAHCVKSYYAEELHIRIGDWDVNMEMEPYDHIDMPVSDIFLHERFFAGSLHNDLALIRLITDINWADVPQVSPVCLPQPHDVFTGTRCWVTGWGQDAFQGDGEMQATLQEVDVPIVDPDYCEKALKKEGLGYRFKLHPGWLCAGGEEGKDACSGDGGGPLVCPVAHGERMALAGLVSWGVGCGKAGVPGVYTNIATYVHWIRETISIL